LLINSRATAVGFGASSVAVMIIPSVELSVIDSSATQRI
jgi:hypothetical protein